MDNEPLKSVPIVEKKPKKIKITAVFLIMLILLVGISLYIAGLFGPNSFSTLLVLMLTRELL